MAPAAEGDEPRVIAVDVETIGIGITPRVPVGGAETEQELAAGGNRDARERGGEARRAALAAVLAGEPPRESLLSLAFGWAENMVQAAIKAVPLGQGAGQRILSALVQAIPPAVDRALALAEGERQAFAPMLAILSAQHETQYSRLFRS